MVNMGEDNIMTNGSIEKFTTQITDDIVDEATRLSNKDPRETDSYRQGFCLTFPLYYTLAARDSIGSLLVRYVGSYKIYEEGFLSEST